MLREKKIYPLTGKLDTSQRYAVLGTAEKFRGHKHAFKAWKALKAFGCTVYPVAQGMDRLEGSKVYRDLQALKGKIDVVVPCLLPEYLSTLAAEAQAAGAEFIWFQEQTWTPELQQQCEELNITTIKGCVLKHKVYSKPFGYLNPCFWHGLKDPKVSRWR